MLSRSGFRTFLRFGVRAVGLASGVFSLGLLIFFSTRAAVGNPVPPNAALSLILYFVGMAFILSGFGSWAIERGRVRELEGQIEARNRADSETFLDIRPPHLQWGSWGTFTNERGQDVTGVEIQLYGVHITNKSDSNVSLYFDLLLTLHITHGGFDTHAIHAGDHKPDPSHQPPHHRPDLLRGPLAIAPKSTKTGLLTFRIPPLSWFSGAGEPAVRDARLTVSDRISGKQVEINVPVVLRVP